MFSGFWWSVRFNLTLKMILPRRGKRDLRNTFWRVRWDQRSRMTYGIMIEEVIDTFRYNTPALEQQEFIRNSQIEASTFHTLSIKKMVFQSSLFKWGHSDAQCWGRFHGKKCVIYKYLPQNYLRNFISHGFYIKVCSDFEKIPSCSRKTHPKIVRLEKHYYFSRILRQSCSHLARKKIKLVTGQ